MSKKKEKKETEEEILKWKDKDREVIEETGLNLSLEWSMFRHWQDLQKHLDALSTKALARTLCKDRLHQHLRVNLPPQ